MEEADILEKAIATGRRLLSHRPRSEFEIRQRLRQRYSHAVAQATVKRLKENGLVNDRVFAQAWSDSRTSHRPRSASLVRRELLEKGVPRDIAQEAVGTLDDEENAYIAGKRSAVFLDKVDYNNFQHRLSGYLHRRGFSYSTVRRITRSLWEEHKVEEVGT